MAFASPSHRDATTQFEPRLAPGRPRRRPSPAAAAHRCRLLSVACRQAVAAGFAPVAPPAHPTYDVYTVIDAALAEDAGDFGDISTNST